MIRGADLTTQEFYRDPSATIARLRALGPLVEVKLPIVGTVWMTTTQEVAGRILKDSVTFTLRKDGGGIAGVPWWIPGIFRALANNMLTFDEPDHTRLRSIVDEAFRRRAVIDMEPRVRAIADELAGELFAEGSPADVVQRFARRLPLSVICELLGLPLADRQQFMAWADAATSLTGFLGFFRMVPGIRAIKRYLEGQLDAAREGGGTGLIAELVRVEKEGAKISREEMVSTVFLLLFAGHETTTHLISGSVYELLCRPDVRDWLMRTLAAATSR